ncbi:MAG: endonuclease domain-containing protein [Candidatus Shapirobacteria bacterium]
MQKKVDGDAINSKRGCVRYWNDLTFMAKQNRKNPTVAERVIWDDLLSNDKIGYRFVRQKPIHRFIVDFYCSKLNLAIEIDGSSHNKKKGTDEMRDKFLHQIGIETIRFTNDEVINNINSVKDILIPLLSKRG